jgi:hypothetical protein
MTDERAALIQALLGDAESAHATYETTELHGEYDREWASWYARYAVDHGIGPMLGHDVSADQLGRFLSESFAAYEQLDPPPAGGWAAYLARRIAAEL